MSARPFIIALVAAALVGGAVFPLLNRKGPVVSAQSSREEPLPAVRTAAVETRAMKRTVRLTGTLRSGSQASLSPKQGGKVLAVRVQEGQKVRRGQELVRLDNSDALRQAEQARAGVAAAKANLEKARSGLRLRRVDVEQRVTQAQRGLEQAKLQLEKAEAGVRLQQRAAQADVQRAQSGVDAARSALEKARKGARPEERKQAQLGVAQAERGVATARKNLDDVEFLFAKGGVPRVQLDQARDGYQKAADGLTQAKLQLDLVNAGARPEDIAAAEAQVRSAEAALSAAKTAASRDELDRADVAAAQSQVRQAEEGLHTAQATRAELELADTDVKAARAAYEQAVAASRLASQQLESASIVSPIDGVVTGVNIHVGEMAGPGMPLVTLVGTSGVYLEAAAPASIVRDLRPGQAVTVTVDTRRGATFAGSVLSVGSVAGPDGRSFPVHVSLSAVEGVLQPGASAQGEVLVESFPDAATVPQEAVRSEEERAVVWLVRDGKIVEVPVVAGVQDRTRTMVRGDVRAGEPVVLTTTSGVRPGDRVQVER
jgi:HlyD family secretion protein